MMFVIVQVRVAPSVAGDVTGERATRVWLRALSAVDRCRVAGGECDLADGDGRRDRVVEGRVVAVGGGNRRGVERRHAVLVDEDRRRGGRARPLLHDAHGREQLGVRDHARQRRARARGGDREGATAVRLPALAAVDRRRVAGGHRHLADGDRGRDRVVEGRVVAVSGCDRRGVERRRAVRVDEDRRRGRCSDPLLDDAHGRTELGIRDRARDCGPVGRRGSDRERAAVVCLWAAAAVDRRRVAGGHRHLADGDRGRDRVVEGRAGAAHGSGRRGVVRRRSSGVDEDRRRRGWTDPVLDYAHGGALAVVPDRAVDLVAHLQPLEGERHYRSPDRGW